MSKSTASFELGFIRLNRRKRESLATQLYRAIRDAILDGQLRKCFRLPSTRGLAQDLGVSRTTVINAFDQLTAEGYLSSVVGKGTFVSEQLPEEHLLVNFGNGQTAQLSSSSKTSPKSQPTSGRHRVSKRKQKLNLGAYGDRLITNNSKGPEFGGPISPFLPGVPALDEFPTKVWLRLYRSRMKSIRPTDLTYGSPAGYAPLRSAIAEYVRAFRGVRCDDDQVFVVAGTQQAVDLVTRIVINDGDEVIFENPGYTRARLAFEMAGARIVPINYDESGFNIEKAVASAPAARLAYVTPSHQFPMGVTLSIERRMTLIEWARNTGGLIFEDDYDSEYRYSNRPIPSLQGLDRGEQTVYVGSFSKVVFPSLSMGYIVVPKFMIDVVTKFLSVSSRPASTLDQMVLSDFIAEGHFARHLRRMRQIYQQRRHALVESVEQHLSDQLKIVGCDAGLHCAALLLRKKDDHAVSRALTEIGVITRPLSSFALGNKLRTPGLVLGFASSTPARIKKSVRKMQLVLN